MSSPITAAPSTFSIWYNEISTPKFPPLYFVLITAVSALIYSLMYRYLPYISKHYLFSSHYKQLSGDKRKEMEWNSRIISNIHAIMITLFGAYVFFSEEQFYKHLNMLHHCSPAVIMTASSIGYFFVDSYYVLSHFPRLGGIPIVIHHLAIIGAQLGVVVYSQFQLMGVTISVTEITTPFINQMWFLTALNRKNTMAFKINGFLIWFFWLMSRVGYSVASVWLWIVRWEQMTTACHFVWVFFTLQLVNITFLNVMWFSKITRGVLKAFLSSAPTTTKDDNNKKQQ